MKLVNSHSWGYKTSSENFLDQWCVTWPSLPMKYKMGFWVISKITSANLCKPVHDIINYSTFIYPIESGKCGKKGKKLQEFEYLKNEKSFLDEIKRVFHSFWSAMIWWKDQQ